MTSASIAHSSGCEPDGRQRAIGAAQAQLVAVALDLDVSVEAGQQFAHGVQARLQRTAGWPVAGGAMNRAAAKNLPRNAR